MSSGASGTGNGTVRLTVAANSSSDRTGTVTIAGHTFTVRQDGACSFTVTPDTISMNGSGGDAQVSIASSNSCDWTASSQAAWIEVSPTQGRGSGSVRVRVERNDGVARTGRVTIAGRTVTVNQASGCTVEVRRREFMINRNGTTRSFEVEAGPGCGWTATSNVPWMRITRGGSGSGNGEVEFTVDRNPGAARTGTIVVGGNSITIRQRGRDDDDDDDDDDR